MDIDWITVRDEERDEGEVSIILIVIIMSIQHWEQRTVVRWGVLTIGELNALTVPSGAVRKKLLMMRIFNGSC